MTTLRKIMGKNVFRFALKILMIFSFISLTSPIAIADNYDASRKIYEMSKEVEAYQKARVEGTYKDYSATPDSVKLFWSLITLGAIIFLSIGFTDWFKELSKEAKKKTITVAIISLVIMSFPILAFYAKTYSEYIILKKFQENDDFEQLNLLNKTLNDYKNIPIESTNNLLKIINGTDPRFSAGKINPSEILNLEGSTKSTTGNYTIIECELNCKIDLLPSNHPISVRTKRIGFYLCKNKAQDLLLTGIYFTYGSYHLEKYYAAAIEYLEKLNQFSTKKIFSENKEFIVNFVADTDYSAGSHLLTDNNGVSFIWAKSDKKGNKIGLDICGNENQKNAWEKSLL